MKPESIKPQGKASEDKEHQERLPYEAPQVQSVRLSDEAAESLT